MKDIAFIIAEYDPFHNGHARQIEQTRAAGAQYVVCILSGNFVQRGDIAMCDKMIRAEMALAGGADLILENPLKYVLSGATYFARGGVETILHSGLEGTLSFGASASAEQLISLSAMLREPETEEKIYSHARTRHIPLAYAVQHVAEKIAPEAAGLLKDPNNVLALEYIAAAAGEPSIDFFAVPRTTVLHDAISHEGRFASGKTIRQLLRSDSDAAAVFLPASTRGILTAATEKGSCPSVRDAYSAVSFGRLLSLTREELVAVNGITEGLENRLLDEIKKQTSLQDLYDAVKTKRFTHARIRQAVVSAVLGVKKADLARENPYLRVLGFNDRGQELLHEMRAQSRCPIVMNLSQAPLSHERTLDAFAGKIFDLCRPVPFGGAVEYRAKPVIVHTKAR